MSWGKGPPVRPVCCTRRATCAKGQPYLQECFHISGRWENGQITFLQKSCIKNVYSGEKDTAFFLCKGQKYNVYFNFKKVRCQGTNASEWKSWFFHDMFLEDTRSTKVYIWGIFYKMYYSTGLTFCHHSFGRMHETLLRCVWAIWKTHKYIFMYTTTRTHLLVNEEKQSLFWVK